MACGLRYAIQCSERCWACGSKASASSGNHWASRRQGVRRALDRNTNYERTSFFPKPPRFGNMCPPNLSRQRKSHFASIEEHFSQPGIKKPPKQFSNPRSSFQRRKEITLTPYPHLGKCKYLDPGNLLVLYQKHKNLL